LPARAGATSYRLALNPNFHDSQAGAPAPAHWRRGPERRLAATRVFDVHGVQFTHPGRGTEREFIVVHVRDWVNIVALTPEGDVVLVRQFRFGIETLSLEVPGGVIEAGEDPVAAGLRELREETGYSATQWAHAGVLHPCISYSTEYIDIWFAQGLQAGPSQLDAGEFLDVFSASTDEFFAWCRGGRITDAKTLTGALWLQNYLSGAWPLQWQDAA